MKRFRIQNVSNGDLVITNLKVTLKKLEISGIAYQQDKIDDDAEIQNCLKKGLIKLILKDEVEIEKTNQKEKFYIQNISNGQVVLGNPYISLDRLKISSSAYPIDELENNPEVQKCIKNGWVRLLSKQERANQDDEKNKNQVENERLQHAIKYKRQIPGASINSGQYHDDTASKFDSVLSSQEAKMDYKGDVVDYKDVGESESIEEKIARVEAVARQKLGELKDVAEVKEPDVKQEHEVGIMPPDMKEFSNKGYQDKKNIIVSTKDIVYLRKISNNDIDPTIRQLAQERLQELDNEANKVMFNQEVDVPNLQQQVNQIYKKDHQPKQKVEVDSGDLQDKINKNFESNKNEQVVEQPPAIDELTKKVAQDYKEKHIEEEQNPPKSIKELSDAIKADFEKNKQVVDPRIEMRASELQQKVNYNFQKEQHDLQKPVKQVNIVDVENKVKEDYNEIKMRKSTGVEKLDNKIKSLQQELEWCQQKKSELVKKGEDNE